MLGLCLLGTGLKSSLKRLVCALGMRKAAAKQRVRQHRADSEPEAARPEAKRGERPKNSLLLLAQDQTQGLRSSFGAL